MLLRFLCVLVLAAAPALAWPAAPGPLLVLGDSLSAAYGIPAAEGWVALLQEKVPEQRVINASISGETTAGGRARLAGLLAEHRPALLVLELGANDGLRGLPLQQIRDNLAAMLKQAADDEVEVVLVGIELPINYGPRYRDGLRGVYRDLAGEFNAGLVPFLLEGVALEPDLMQDDGLHPTAAAQPRLLENVWQVLGPKLDAVGR